MRMHPLSLTAAALPPPQPPPAPQLCWPADEPPGCCWGPRRRRPSHHRSPSGCRQSRRAHSLFCTRGGGAGSSWCVELATHRSLPAEAGSQQRHAGSRQAPCCTAAGASHLRWLPQGRTARCLQSAAAPPAPAACRSAPQAAPPRCGCQGRGVARGRGRGGRLKTPPLEWQGSSARSLAERGHPQLRPRAAPVFRRLCARQAGAAHLAFATVELLSSTACCMSTAGAGAYLPP